MKRTISGIGLILLLVGMLALAFSIHPTRAEPTTWIVDDDGPADFSSIQEAIDNPDVKDGDTIMVRDGTYFENVDVNKSLNIKSEIGADTTVVRAANSNDHVFEVTADGVDISGFTVRQVYSPSGYASGIVLTGTRDCEISENKMDSFPMSHGIALRDSRNNILKGNMINRTATGISLAGSHYNLVINNTMQRNNFGISLHKWIYDECQENIITRNKIANNFHAGIRLGESNNNIIYLNHITDNWRGIHLEVSLNNTIYHNNLIDNTLQVNITSPGCPNFWDDRYPSGGNYWSDYVGVDADGDGIGDTPYTIDTNNQDNYPFMEPWSIPTMIKTLIRTVTFWNIHKGIERSLASKLEGALRLLDKGNQNLVVHKLMAFINQVEALKDKKLTFEQADQLISEAQGIIDLI